MIGSQLEEAGWRQGSVVHDDDIANLLQILGVDDASGITLIVASQSCDIANNNCSDDPYIEFFIARAIKLADNNFTFNKNVRKLHTTLHCQTTDSNLISDHFLSLKAYEKVTLLKEKMIGRHPDKDRILSGNDLHSFVAWLAARYKRPALPTSFNNRLKATDKNNKKQKSIAKKVNHHLSGIYLKIVPDAEILDTENYSVDLLGLVPAGFRGDLDQIQPLLDEYKIIMERSGMDVRAVIAKEDEISIAQIKQFKRFYYDDLSFRDNEAPHPPETLNILYLLSVPEKLFGKIR
ncbi:MAG: hypothetical protein ACI9NY_001724 [Kiritimatiellia bacterium]